MRLCGAVVALGLSRLLAFYFYIIITYFVCKPKKLTVSSSGTLVASSVVLYKDCDSLIKAMYSLQEKALSRIFSSLLVPSEKSVAWKVEDQGATGSTSVEPGRNFR